MQIAKKARTATRRFLGPRLTNMARRILSRNLPSIETVRSHLRGSRGLEIGGPSALFADDGAVPIYDLLQSLDNCLYSAKTLWTSEVHEGQPYLYHPGRAAGRQFICDATALIPIADRSYDCLIASHCLEHVANPLRALEEWQRVLRENGLLLLVLPHKDGTFDWKRTVTPLAHMIEDYDHAVGEDDLTHLPEIVELHDSAMHPVGTKQQFRERCLANFTNRAMHHHVFDTMGALALVDRAGFGMVAVDTLKPAHIVVLASRTADATANRAFLETGAQHWRRSPFPSDRAHAGK